MADNQFNFNIDINSSVGEDRIYNVENKQPSTGKETTLEEKIKDIPIEASNQQPQINEKPQNSQAQKDELVTIKKKIVYEDDPNNDKKNANNSHGGKYSIKNIYRNAAHPITCLTIIFSKGLAVLCFFFLDKLLPKKIEAISYVVLIIIGSFDFWIVKNIAGRQLVGLRWWNEVKEDGNEVWIYESKNEKKESSLDRTIFWFMIYFNCILWGALTVWEAIKLSPTWTIMSIIMFIFGFINLYGYFKCSKDQQNKLKGITYKIGYNVVKKKLKKASNSNPSGITKNQSLN